MLRCRTYSNKVDSGKYQTCYGDYGIQISSDYGKTWKRVYQSIYSSEDTYDIAISADGKYQFISAYIFFISSDYGNTWRGYNPSGDTGIVARIYGAFISHDGKCMVTMVNFTLYTSFDYGNTWSTFIFPSYISDSLDRDFFAMSDDGRYMVISLNTDCIYVSSNYGKNWSRIDGTYNNRAKGSAKISPDGKRMAVCHGQHGVLVSSDYGVTWEKATSVNRTWMAFAANSDCKYLVAKTSPIQQIIMTSSDYGSTWKEITATWYCTNMTMSSDGKYILGYYVVNYNGKVFISSDYGNTWKEILTEAVKDVKDCAVSADGRYMTIVLGRYNDSCYISSDYGSTWQKSAFGASIGTYRIAMNI